MQIAAENKKIGKSATVEYKVGATLKENTDMFGEAIVNDIFLQQLTVKVQAGIRACLEAGKDPQQWANAYKPGVKTPSIAKDPKAAARAAIGAMSEEERKQLIADIKAGKL